jgi:ubiquinone/menaquinone biosynthesis C-methylase UbiE
MPFFDIGYFKKKINRKKITKTRNIKNKFLAWKLDKDYYDGHRQNGYGGFKYDARWKRLLPKLIKKYKLTKKSKILEIGCKKGFLLFDLNKLLPGIRFQGIENHQYPLKKANKKIKGKLYLKDYHNLKNYKKREFDLVIAFNSIYMQNLGDTIKTISEIKRISKKSYISLASYEKKKDRDKFLDWTLLGTTILKKSEWKKIFKFIGYNGDYYFSDANKLGL